MMTAFCLKTLNRASFFTRAAAFSTRSPDNLKLTAGETNLPFAARPTLKVFGQIVLSGKPNVGPVAAGSKLNVEDFVTGALKAVEVVTSSTASGDVGAIASLVSDSCLSDLKSYINSIPVEDRQTLPVRSEDVFFSFVVSGIRDNVSERHIVHFVTYSLHDLATIRKEMNDLNLSLKSLLSTASKDNVEETTDKFRENRDADIALQRKFMDTDITISNVILAETADEQWLVEHIAMRQSSQVMSKLAALRWKGRLRFTLSGRREFLSILRFDYSTDLFMVVAFIMMLLF